MRRALFYFGAKGVARRWHDVSAHFRAWHIRDITLAVT
jgi:hypothetical protein